MKPLVVYRTWEFRDAPHAWLGARGAGTRVIECASC